MERVKWKIDFLSNGADAQRVYEELGNTEITAKEILEKAKNPDSELHKLFEWDDRKAAEKYRLQQAGAIVRNLVFVTDDEKEEPIRVFHISTEPKKYKPTKLILQQPDEYLALLQRAKDELYAFQRKYKSLVELEEVFDAIDAL